MRRVAVTGAGIITSLGNDWKQFKENLVRGNSGVVYISDWDRFRQLNTRLGAPVSDLKLPEYPRKRVRSMGRVALLATHATELAIEDAGLTGNPVLRSGQVGVAYGSATGSVEASVCFADLLMQAKMNGITANTYIRMMGHTTAVNIGLYFGLKGRIINTSTACTSGSQGIGFSYEQIKTGKQTIMIAGGCEEMSVTIAAVFDTLYATSTLNDNPRRTPRPFDRERDGLVVGEGAGTLILEDLEHALARGAKIYCELVGYGSNSDGDHVTQPAADTMQVAMKLALEDAGLDPSAIGYVNAHGTATEQGDIAESHATAQLFGNRIPFSSLKGNIGHTIGACGAIESWATINMMNEDLFAPTLNLDSVDEACAELDYIMHSMRQLNCEYVMNNNFAFGGINTSLIYKRSK